MSLGERIIAAIKERQVRKQRHLSGPIGEFYRHGGNELLYDLPVSTNDIIIDAGGFEGEWTSKMLIRYGCRSEVFEPIPAYASRLQRLFQNNGRVNLHATALGGSPRVANFSIASDGSSEFLPKAVPDSTEVEVEDICAFIELIGEEPIACLKINIEGGEYEVLERLIDTRQSGRFKSFLIQFHRWPDGWEGRRSKITEQLSETHKLVWCYPMVWGKMGEA